MWWLLGPIGIGAYVAKKIYDVATEDNSSSPSSSYDDEYERAKRNEQDKKIKLIKKDLVDQFKGDIQSFFAENSDVITGTVPNNWDFNTVNKLLSEFSANVWSENFLKFVKITGTISAASLQFIKKNSPHSLQVEAEALWDVFSTESPVEPANFLQFIKKIAPDADYTEDFKQVNTDIQQLDTEIKQLRKLKNEFLHSFEENL
ncbi:hypothetical protein A1507_22235 [Methylomonas koyamae]|uniref:Uncharacterized protein n=1 Tax=Methylomonas koyamae TaxID=702114 RepID=A0A177NSJ7_9GAMM|nr:hypothetical protein [Methylomonas koyamae]OAI21027.1 hypothetical protein A1507_22235 [Methylomonas koyamae]